jgi:predicted DsbA family dithiol-disulfide isomerase
VEERLLHAHFGEGRSVLDDIRTAQELGATGVPFSVVDRRYGAAGAQPADLLLPVVEQAWADTARSGQQVAGRP